MNGENEQLGNSYEKLKCIWMASQVIEYKLCNNQFDCENCLFDKVMRNLLNKKETESAVKPNVVDVISSKLREIKFDDKIIYLKNNIIAKEICPNTYFLGINPILNCFLDSVCSMTLNECGKEILNGQQIIQISGEWGNVSISAPVNFLIHDRVGESTDNPLKSQWFAIIGSINQEISNRRLNEEEWDTLHNGAIYIIEEIKSHMPKIGDTMMDGGTQIKFLHQLVGNKKYINILKSLCI